MKIAVETIRWEISMTSHLSSRTFVDVVFSADEDCESFTYEVLRDRCQEYKNSGRADRKVTGLSLVDLNDDGF